MYAATPPPCFQASLRGECRSLPGVYASLHAVCCRVLFHVMSGPIVHHCEARLPQRARTSVCAAPQLLDAGTGMSSVQYL